MSHYGLNHLGQTSNISTLLFAQDILVLLLEAKSSQQAAAQPFAQRHRCLPYHISDVSLLSLLSSSLDYGHLLNYFLETNLFFNLGVITVGQMAICLTVIAPLSLVSL